MIIYHKHHIVPRHMGGTDDPTNLIKVNTAMHAFLHKLLWEEHGNQYDYIAWKCLSGQITNEEANILATKEANSGKEPWNKGKRGLQKSQRKGVPRTKEEKRKISAGTKKGMMQTTKKLGTPKGTVPWNKGKSGEKVSTIKRCSCLLCKKEITTNTLSKHYSLYHIEKEGK